MGLRLRPAHLIVFGIVLTLSAALIQHLIVSKMYAQLDVLEEKIAGYDIRIDSLWQQHVEAERKKEFAALIGSADASADSPSETLIEHYLASIRKSTTNTDVKENRIKTIDEHQVSLRDQIDLLYLDRLESARARLPIQRMIDRTNNIALLLQALGLVLVLSRDLVR